MVINRGYVHHMSTLNLVAGVLGGVFLQYTANRSCLYCSRISIYTPTFHAWHAKLYKASWSGPKDKGLSPLAHIPLVAKGRLGFHFLNASFMQCHVSLHNGYNFFRALQGLYVAFLICWCPRPSILNHVLSTRRYTQHFAYTGTCKPATLRLIMY